MQVGCLGEIVFEVSSKSVKTINNMTWAGSALYATHSRHLQNALTEFTGLAPDTISIDIYLSAYLSVSPMDDINKIWQYEREGRPVPLVIGDKVYGKYRWTIKSHKIKAQTYDKRGNLTGATVFIELLEYLQS